MAEKQQRIAYPDGLRAIAIFLVVLAHTMNFGKLNSSGLVYHVYTFIDESFCRQSVPLFVMISGMFMLRKDVSYPDLFKKYILRMLAALALFGSVYSLTDRFLAGELTLWNAVPGTLRDLLSGNCGTHMWFMYMIIGIYLCIPFLRKIISGSDKRDVQYLLGFLVFFISVLPFINEFSPWKINFYSMMFVDNMLYFVLGYYLGNYEIGKKQRRILYLTAGAFYAVWVLLCLFFFHGVPELQNFAGHTMAPLHLVLAVTYFVWLKYHYKGTSILHKALKWFAPLSFGIYLMHPMILHGLHYFGIHAAMAIPYLMPFLIALPVYLACAGVTFLLKKIPKFGKIL